MSDKKSKNGERKRMISKRGYIPEVLDDRFALVPRTIEKRYKYITILKNILPFIGSNEGRIVLAEVMVALKLEGIIGKRLSDPQSKMVAVIRDSILTAPEKRREALQLAQRLLR